MQPCNGSLVVSGTSIILLLKGKILLYAHMMSANSIAHKKKSKEFREMANSRAGVRNTEDE